MGANSGNRPKLYAPSNWEQGSSYSHLDETTFPPGNPNSLMTPQIGNAEPIHAPGPVTLGIFRDMGWSTQSGGGTSVVKWEETFTSGSPPPNWLVVDNDGSGDALEYRQLVVFQGGDTVQPQIAQSFWFGNFSNANSSGLIDEWLITPRVQNIDAGDSLYFWAGAIGGSFDDSLKVFVSTTGNSLSDFTNQIAYFKVDGPVSSWHQYGFDLTPFNGEDIYIAVNYYIVDGGPAGTHSDNVWIDHFLITTDSVTGISDPDRPIANRIPQGYSLQQNYPNPFNPVTHIPFSLSKAGHVKIEVYNSLGQKVTSLLNEYHPAGRHEVAFDAHRFSSGIYYYQLEVNGFR
ncbi:MAG: T9SS type A sorting domain-containing protein, partial [Calditrichae bacterium]|nr:T9SS type A sorting domain-containing protein [Calditrichia bacterium]